MSDAITELRRLRDLYENNRGTICTVGSVIMTIDARIAELEAQQAEPSDAEIEAWQKHAMSTPYSGDAFLRIVTKHEISMAVALMRRGRGDQRLREAARQIREITSRYVAMLKGRMDERGDGGLVVATRIKNAIEEALRAALGEQ